MGFFILDANGLPAAVYPEVWGEWMDATAAIRAVAKTGISDCYITTYFHGVAVTKEANKALALWESLVVGGQLDGKVVTYCSRKDALAGHYCLVDLVKETVQANKRKG